jgi:HlyD family secretion protein
MGLIVALAAAGAAAWLLRSRQQQNAAPRAAVRAWQATAAAFERTVRVAGTTSARNFANIAAPMMRSPDAGRNMTLISLANSGAMVKQGETIAEIDAQAVKDHVDDINSFVVQAEGDVRKRRADQAIQMENLMQSLRQAKAALDKARLDYAAEEIRTAIDQELLKLSVEESDAAYNELVKEIEIMKTSQAAEIRILELTRDRHMRHRDRHKADIERFTMKAPISGLVVMQSIWRGGDMGQVQVGDQVTPGQPFMKIVDTNSMQLDASVNQVESEGIRIGQTARVNFDAFPDLHLVGKVYSIGALAAGGWRQNYYIRAVPIRISIEASERRVIPDLSASANIVLDTKENVVAVPREAVFREGGRTVVYVKRGEGYEARAVTVGARNHTQVEILAGVTAGEEIALGRVGEK